jgi:hypothetical protein
MRTTLTLEPDRREVTAYTAPDQSRVLSETEALDGGDVLPGYTLSIAEWFERAGWRESDE